jgi:hypothetical protein
MWDVGFYNIQYMLYITLFIHVLWLRLLGILFVSMSVLDYIIYSTIARIKIQQKYTLRRNIKIMITMNHWIGKYFYDKVNVFFKDK